VRSTDSGSNEVDPCDNGLSMVEKYDSTSREFLEKAYLYLQRGDLIQASEKGWEAAAQAVRALADRRGMPHNGHAQLFEVLKLLVEETGDQELWDLFHVANSLYSNSHENWLPREGVDTGLSDVGELVHRLETKR
jgi:uncharacterized protein (UPF0332 family)